MNTVQELQAIVADLQQRIRRLEDQRVSTDRVGPFQRHSTTSRSAAFANYPRSGSQRHRILMFLEGQGEHGATRQELAQQLGLSDDSVRPRVVELMDGGWVRATDRTRPTLMGEAAEVVVAIDRLKVEEARQAVSPSVSEEPGWGSGKEQPLVADVGTTTLGSSETPGRPSMFDPWEG